MNTLHTVFRAIHIGAGFVGLVVFWIPVITTKGSTFHRLFGKIFVACAAVVIGSALFTCVAILLDPFAFDEPGEDPRGQIILAQVFGSLLGVLAYLTLIPLILGVRILRTRRNPERLATPLMRGIVAGEAGLGVAVAAFGAWRWRQEPSASVFGLLIVLGLLALKSWNDHRRFLANPLPTPMAWWVRHMEFMLTCGIAFHTAFLVFGAGRMFGPYLSGAWRIVPWVLPTLLGVPLMWLWIRAYRAKFDNAS